jgi:trigger factor
MVHAKAYSLVLHRRWGAGKEEMQAMTVKWEKIENNVGVLEVEVDADKVSNALDQAFKKVVKTVSVPGFRKGKVPRFIFENRFGVEVLYNDALDILLPEAYAEAVKETKIEPVDRPEIDIIQMEKGKPLLFKAKVTVKPEVKLGKYKGFEIPNKEFPVTAEDVEKELGELQKSHAEIVVLEDGEVQQGDLVIIDFEGFVDGEAFEGGQAEGYQLEIGSGTFIPGFEEQLIGMKKGEEKEITVTFPEKYHVASLAGKEAVFKIKLHEIKRKQLPVLDDEFAKDISEFATLDELKADLENKLKERAEHEKEHYVEEAVIEEAVKHAEIDLPPVMIENEIDNMMNDFKQRLQFQGIPFDMYLQFTGTTEENMRAEMKDNAEKRVRTSLVLEAIAEAEKIEPSEEEINEEVKKIAESAKMEEDRVRQLLQARDPGLTGLKNELKIRKTVKFLVDQSTLV